MPKSLIALLIATSFLYFSTYGQKGKVSFGIEAGANMNKMFGKDYDGDKIKNQEFNPGFHAGVNLDIPLSSVISIQAGLQITTKGTKRSSEDFIGNYIARLKTYYVELPVKLVYKPQLGKGNLLLGIGPDVAYGISGKWKSDYEGGSQFDRDGKIKFKNTIPDNPNANEDFLRPLDVSVSLIVGYQLANNLYFHLNGQMGLIKINPKYTPIDPDDKSQWKNMGLGISVGYRFGKK